MEIRKVTDPSFGVYGKVLKGYGFDRLLKEMGHTPVPDDGVIYVASVEELEGLPVAAKLKERAYGGPVSYTHLLQRQQASAIIDARKMIVDGAVGMVEMALERLNENQVVELDEERKAAMVSNLLVVLCGNHDAQPIVNSGTLY